MSTGILRLRYVMWLALFLVGSSFACQPTGGTLRHNLASTKGEVRFASSREAFYKERWIREARAQQPMICAGFVHHRPFGHYLKFGHFELEMTMEVFQQGEPHGKGHSASDWRGGKLLRTSTKRRAITASSTSYVICGHLHRRGTWTQGAMRYTFVLRGPKRAMDEHMARGVLPIVP